jgi:hypothetical protein
MCSVRAFAIANVNAGRSGRFRRPQPTEIGVWAPLAHTAVDPVSSSRAA